MPVYSAKSISAKHLIGGVGIRYKAVEADGKAYYHGVSEPGVYRYNPINFLFCTTEVDLVNYPYFCIEYRTNSKCEVLDITLGTQNGESWLKNRSKMAADGEWHKEFFSIYDMTGGAGVPEKNDTGVYINIKPFGTGSLIVLAEQGYFDIRYIGCFTSADEAKEHVFTDTDEVLEAPKADVFWQKADKGVISKYMNETDALIDEILSSPTTVDVTGRRYYVSSTGDDNNDGLSPDAPWKSMEKVNGFEFEKGDGVFFKRGDIWRIEIELRTQSGVTYSAYGAGAKPKIIASADGSGEDKWIETEYPGVYAYTKKIPAVKRNVGTVVFDGGRAWGIKVLKKTNGNRLDNGTVFNGIESYSISERPLKDHGGLVGDLEFYHNRDDDTLYLCSKEGNPGKRFKSIEISRKGLAVYMNSEDIVIDNLEIVGAGTHGIGGQSVKNVTVQYCVLKWIGGTVQTFENREFGLRYGNAIESYGNAENFTIRYCYASQVYDCCYTVQCGSKATFKDVHMYKNVAEFCNTGLEIWQGGGLLENMNLHDNYTRFSGYGYSHQRPRKDGNFFYGASNTSSTYINNNVCGNVNCFSSKYALLAAATGPKQYNFHDNLYILEKGKYIGGITPNPGIGRGRMVDVEYTEEELSYAVYNGFERGGRFYYTEPELLGNMYDLYTVQKQKV